MRRHEELECLVLAALGEPCEKCARVIATLLVPVNNLKVGALDGVASACGFPARWALARHLGKHGLPPPRPLKHWLCFLVLRWAWDAERLSLQRQAMRMGTEPSVLHRLIRRTSGGTWETAKRRESSHWLGVFQAEIGTPIRCARTDSR